MDASTPAAEHDSTLKARSPQPAAAAQSNGSALTGVKVDDAAVAPCYANFCRVTGTPEEVVLDFGINTQPFNSSPEPIRVQQRVVLNFYTAKRMLRALELTLQRHEAAFGVIETDVQKRLVPGGKPEAPAA